MTHLRLLSLNLHGGFGRDGRRNLDRVNALMDRFNVDVGVFQEMETRFSRGGNEADIERLAGAARPHHCLGPNMHEGQGWYGNLIVSRHPILRKFHHDLQTRSHLEPRGAVDALLQTPLGKIRIVGTHLSLSSFERRGEAQRLIKLMAEVEREEKNPVLLMGDINEWQRPSKLLRFLDSVMIPVPCAATFPAFFPVLKLDRVWHDMRDFHVMAHPLADKQSRMISDHLAVLVSVGLRN